MGSRKFLVLAVVLALPCFGQSNHPGRASTSCVPVQARVISLSGAPVSGATVEIMNLDNGTPLSPHAFSQNVFDVPCIAAGNYRFTARLGTLEASEDVSVSLSSNDIVVLRLPTESANGLSSSPSVSVSQLKVPEKAIKLLRKAREKLASKDIAAAFAKANEAIQVDGTFSGAYEIRGLVKLEQQHTSDAIADLAHAVKLDAGNTMARVLLGAAYNSSKQFADAVHTLEAATPLAANLWQLHYELGKAYAGVGRFRESLASLTRAVELNPKYAPIRYARGALLVHTGQYQDAAADLNQYLHDSPDGPDALKARQLLAGIQK